ncbi:Putative ribosomal N-acetyltransferase YdaF [Dermatophilus congolensis]|uniref:Ribosomal N-acetyltransferase YdaF n=1 Tax=Dermatophilus congolensis TaxID=1863 RepID=A0AA46H1H1_9MICO|nr:GNAT family protein [Dermatophilus congolensis]STD15274.1 Putative ribosomal N-acetyltransferase YdaF [Dermatophilus congolensis]
MNARRFSELDWPRRTQRLTIRPATMADADTSFAQRSIPQVGRWMTSQPDNRQAFQQAFRLGLENTLILESDSGAGSRVIGEMRCQVKDAWGQREIVEQARQSRAELGWFIIPQEHGKGYGLEAVTELLAIAFDGVGVRRVEAGCFAENEASWRLMERLGMRREGHYIAESLHRDGTWRDTMMYALLAKEWRDRHKHQQQ